MNSLTSTTVQPQLAICCQKAIEIWLKLGEQNKYYSGSPKGKTLLTYIDVAIVLRMNTAYMTFFIILNVIFYKYTYDTFLLHVSLCI